jgi:hypothetical protein
MFGYMFVKALAARVILPSPSGPIEESCRNCCHTGCVSQYNPAPPRITVFLSLPTDQAKPTCGAKIEFTRWCPSEPARDAPGLTLQDGRQVLRPAQECGKETGLEIVS